MIHVAIVSPDHSLEPVDKVISEINFGCHFQKYIYKKMTDIDSIYEDCRENSDVIFFSGELGYHYIRNKFPDIRIPCAFTAYEPIDVLSILLNFQIDHPGIALSRVFCDFLTETNHFMEVPSYLPKEKCPYFFTDTHYDYQHITRFAKKLWDEGKIDYILSRSINNLKRLDELQIPYAAVFPSEDMIIKSIRTALNELRLNAISAMDELNILLHLPLTEDVEQEESEFREATIYKMLVDYRKKMHLHYTIRQGFKQFELHSQIKAGEKDVKFLRPMLLEFRNNVAFPFRIGAGISSSKERSRYFSEQALVEATRYGKSDAFLVGDDGLITGPISSEKNISYNYTNEKALLFARVNGINEANILRLVSLFQEDQGKLLNSRTLAPLLGLTTRSANRILSKLLELGIVEYALPEGSNGHPKGRPCRDFRYNQDEFRKALM